MSDVTVLGGGIIGICSAIALREEGHRVELIDRGRPQESASFGNCALLAVGEVVPISKPGVVQKIPGWLRDPEGPLHVRRGSMVRQMPWLLRFLHSGRPKRVAEISRALAPLTRRAEADYVDLLAKAGISNNLVDAENLMVYNSKTDYEADRFTWNLRSEHGFEHEALTQDEVRTLEPALGGPIGFGVLLKGWKQFSDPGLMLERLRRHFIARGGKIREASAERIESEDDRAVGLTLTDGQRVPVRELVLAAGAWSGRLARTLGLRLPVAALQGYHHHLPYPGVTLNRAVLWANGGFVLTPMESGLRIAGTIEVADHDPVPNLARADVIARKAQRILPGLDIAGGTQWMGPRPFMPDTLPVIGRAPRHANVVLALGHGQLGMTLGPTTGKLVADIVAHRAAAVDLTPYRPNRF